MSLDLLHFGEDLERNILHSDEFEVVFWLVDVEIHLFHFSGSFGSLLPFLVLQTIKPSLFLCH